MSMSITKEDDLKDVEVLALRDLFMKFDADRTGTVPFETVDEILRTAARVVTDPELKKSLKNPDAAGREKKMQFADFMELVTKKTRAFNPITDLHDAFRVFDRDGHGFITTAELRHVVTSLGERMTDDEADELIREADPKTEGHIDYEEFIKTISVPLPPGEYGRPPAKRVPAPPPREAAAPSEQPQAPHRESTGSVRKDSAGKSSGSKSASTSKSSGEKTAELVSADMAPPAELEKKAVEVARAQDVQEVSPIAESSAGGSSSKGSGEGTQPTSRTSGEQSRGSVSGSSNPVVEAVEPEPPAESRPGQLTKK